MNNSATTEMAHAADALTMIESVPCEVRYVVQNGQTYATLTKDDLDALLRERRLTYKVLRITLAVALVGWLVAAGYAAWVGYGPLSHVIAVPVGCAK